MFDPSIVKQDFPIFARKINGHELVYLDSGATSQKPKQVIVAITHYYETSNSNVHRGAHSLGDESTKLLEEAREKVAKFIGAVRAEELIFVRNTTEAINLVAYSWGMSNLREGDVILTTEMEHHADLVPWQQVAERTGAKVELVSVDKDGLLDQKDYVDKLTHKPKLVAIVQVSNALGTVNPVKEMTRAAKQAGAVVLIDGAQAVPHMKVDVKSIGCDFYAFSGHKMLGPMGIGGLWGKRELLESMPPFLTGGGMISEVYPDHATFAPLPDKFEAGTPNVAGAVGLAAAVEYLEKLGMEEVKEHDRELVSYALEQLGKVKELEIMGTRDASLRSGSVSFTYTQVHAHDVATILDSEGVAVRSGQHCTMPLHDKLGVAASIRASFNVYNTHEDIDRLVLALAKVKEIFGR